MHVQTEKQRIIWAYKILFLDVLFPLNLKKVGSAVRSRTQAQHFMPADTCACAASCIGRLPTSAQCAVFATGHLPGR